MEVRPLLDERPRSPQDPLRRPNPRLTHEPSRPGPTHRSSDTLAEIGEIARFASAKKLCGHTGLCARVNQAGDKDRPRAASKHGPKHLRWAMLEATMQAPRHPAYNERYQRNKRRLGKQRGAKVAQIDIASKLSEAIWHMLTNNQPFAPAPGGATLRLAA